MAGEVEHLVGEAPLVVVPSHELDEVVVECETGLCVEDGGVSVGLEVGGNDLVVNVLENALHRAFGSGLHCGADVVVGGGLVETDGQVNDGDIAGGDTHGSTGQLALQLGNDLADCLCGTGGGGDNVVVNGATETPVLLGEAVNNSLSGGRGVNGGHETLDDAEVVIENLRHGGEAVGGAGSVGDELHVGSVLLEVDAADEHRGVVLCGTGHHDDLCAGVDVSLSGLLGEEAAGALENVLHAELAPGQESGVTVLVVRENLNGLAVDGEGACLVVGGDATVEATVNGVILDGVSQLACGVTGSIDCDDLDVISLDGGAEGQRADTTETIDTNFDHIRYPP